MRYLHTMIRIRDLEASLRFYCDILGMKEIRRRESRNGRFTLVFLAAPEDEAAARTQEAPTLELTWNWPDEKGAVPEYGEGRNFGHLAFEVDNIYEFCTRLQEQGVTINRPPRDGYMAFIRSPDNISIEILQKGQRLRPAEPWASMENTGYW